MIREQVKKVQKRADQSAFQDRSDRFAVDQLLRNHGYHIHRRRGKSEPIWVQGGVKYRQQEALLRIAKFQVSGALHKDQEYWEGE